MKNGEQSLKQLLKSVDYKSYFTNHISQDYVLSLNKLFAEGQMAEKKQALEQMSSLMTVYSLLVYKIYSINPKFRKEIDSSPELKANFLLIKAYLDSKNGESVADGYITKMDKYFS